MTFDEAFAAFPLVAILRGVEPTQVAAIGEVLVEAGFTIIEVPLNSPDPLRSIEILAQQLGTRAIVGAGTVLKASDVHAVKDRGGQLVVAPNLDSKVGAAAKEASLSWCPGVMTPTEAFAALDQGAAALKIFPAELVPPPGIAAMRAVLPTTARIVVVGGIKPTSIQPYRSAGADGFGLGSALFKPGISIDAIRQSATDFVASWATRDAYGH
jgi:2-dehydro-3-deoxyphosphogalactonate aldolase